MKHLVKFLVFLKKNGDIFAFDSDVNTPFLHGVPKVAKQPGPRISIIAWGKRKSLSTRNGGTGDVVINDTPQPSQVFSSENNASLNTSNDGENKPDVDIANVTDKINTFVMKEEEAAKPGPKKKRAKKKRSRIQGRWGGQNKTERKKPQGQAKRGWQNLSGSN